MAKYKAVQGFTGIATMKKGEVKNFNPNEIWVQDLVKHGFIAPVKAEKKEEPAEAPTEAPVEEPIAEAEEAPKKKAPKKAKAKKSKE